MPAIISGRVFDDLDHNGIVNGSDPGIQNAYVVLRNPAGTCTNTQTDATGNYSFINLNTAGTYTIYETVANPGATCPPTTFTQPSGFNGSTTARVRTVTVTASDITNNTNLSGNNFGHDNLESFGCTSFAYLLGIPGSATPPTSRLFRLDLKTGNTVDLGRINQPSTSTSALNGFGYNNKDGNFYGYNPNTNSVFRVTKDLTLTDFTIPNLPVPNFYTIGDVDANGYLYIYRGTTEIFVIDVDPNRGTYMKLVDPANSFQEDTSPFGLPISQALSIGDFSFNPQDGQLYTVLFGGTSGGVFKINPLSGAVTTLTVNPSPVVGNYGGTFFDNYNNLYASDNNTTEVFKYELSPIPNPTTATRSLFSTTGRTTNDGARCPTAPIAFASVESTKSATPVVGVGDTITYTVVLNNVGNQTADNLVFIDTLPNGTTFTNGTFKLNGATVPGNPNPPSGISLGSIAVGFNTVTFEAIATTVPSPNPTPNTASTQFQFTDGTNPQIYTNTVISNVASTTIVVAQLASVKSVTPSFANIGTSINYTIVYTNTGNTTATNIIFIDTIPNGTSYVSTTLKQDGNNVTGTPNPPGATLPNSIGPGRVSTITFSVTVTTVPVPNPIPNNATASFNYTGNPTIPTTRSGNTSSNTVNVQFNQANLGSIVKGVDKVFATCGEIITYTVSVPNNGNTTANNVVLSDTVPNGTVLVPNSILVNGAQSSATSPSSIPLGNINPGAITTVSFSVQVQC